MNLVAIIGDPGSGKTNLLTKYLHEYHCAGWPVSANYELKFDYISKGFDELAELPPDINGFFVGIDELGVGADSYEWMGSTARGLTTLAAEIRKRNCIFVYTTQHLSYIASRLRGRTDTFILMEDNDAHISHCKHYLNPATCPGLPTCSGYVCAGMFHRLILDRHGNLIKEDDFNGAPYWNLYSTGEMVRLND